MRQKLDDLGTELGSKLRVFFPWNTPPRVMETTGNSRPNASPAPCECDWEMRDDVTGMLEWIPGWYVATRTR